MIYQKLIDEANKIFKEYDLEDWVLDFDKAKRRFGLCSYRKKLITMSKELVRLNFEKNFKQVHETLLHEIGHALSFKRYGNKGIGHGYYWRLCVIELGGNPQRLYKRSEVEIVKGKFKYVCDGGHEHYTHRKLKRRYSCKDCGKEHNIIGFNEKFVIRLEG